MGKKLGAPLVSSLALGCMGLIFSSESHSDDCVRGQVYTGPTTQFITNWEDLGDAMDKCKQTPFSDPAENCRCNVCAIRAVEAYSGCDGENIYNTFNNSQGFFDTCGSYSDIKNDYTCPEPQSITK